MRHRSLAIVASALVVIFLGTFTASAAGPPAALTSYLTPNGKVVWNLDALVNDTFGDRTDCFDGQGDNIFAVARNGECPGPAARYATYVFTFLNARGSAFHRVSLASPPNTGVTNNPIRVDDSYVSCPHGEYQHGGPGWLVIGGAGAPDGEIWCE
jgi:hypothetical protein